MAGTAVTSFPAKSLNCHISRTRQTRFPLFALNWDLVSRILCTKNHVISYRGTLRIWPVFVPLWSCRDRAGKKVTAVTFFRCPTVAGQARIFCLLLHWCISGDCIAITWRHLIFFYSTSWGLDQWSLSFRWQPCSVPDHDYCYSSPKSQPADWKLSVESHAVTHRLTLPDVGDPRNIAQHWQLDLWNWEHFSQTYRIHVEHAIGYFKSFRLLSGILPLVWFPCWFPL